MRDRLHSAVLPLALALALALVFAMAGCAGDVEQGQDGGGEQEEQQADMNLEIVEQWAQSPHSRVIISAAGREECQRCHDGEAFTTYTAEGTLEATGAAQGEESTGAAGDDDGQEQSSVAEEEAELPPRDWAVSIDCRVCHTGVGVEIAESGTTSIPGEPAAQGGSGALCMTCHNSRHEAEPASEERSAPHYSPAADVVLGVNIMPTTAMPEETPHAEIEDTCVGCHLEDENGDISHEFRFQNWEGCTQDGCHENDPREAAEDYDGDGTKEDFQVEIEGMLESAKATIEDQIGGTFKSERGSIVFAGADGRPITNVEDDVYSAAYNYLLLWNDGSRGVHNPELAIEVLRSISGTGTAGAGGAQGSTTTTP